MSEAGDNRDFLMAVSGPLVEVCGAAAASSKGRRALQGLARALGRAGLGAFADEHLAPLTVREGGSRPSRDGGARLNRMRSEGRISDNELRAGIEIRHAHAEQGASGAVVGAVDPSRLVVDRGKIAVPTAPSGGRSEPCVARYDEWRRAIAGREERRRWVVGSKDRIPVVTMITAVVVDGEGTSGIEARLGVKRGHVERAVLAELRLYARAWFNS